MTAEPIKVFVGCAPNGEDAEFHVAAPYTWFSIY
jgi:hypothetical protein